MWKIWCEKVSLNRITVVRDGNEKIIENLKGFTNLKKKFRDLMFQNMTK